MRIKAVFIRIVRQFLRDRRTLALLLLAPVLVLTLLWLVLGNNEDYTPEIGLVGTIPLDSEDMHLQHLTKNEAMDMLESGDLDAVLNLDKKPFQLTLEGSTPSHNQAVMQVLKKAIGTQGPAQKLDISYLHGGDSLTLFDYDGSVFIGFFAFFFVFLIAGVTFLRERTTGTLERVLTTPIRRSELVIGYLVGFGFFSILQTVILSAFAVYVLGIELAGAFIWLLLLAVLTALVALTLGSLMSAFAQNELQMIQFIPIVIVPQFFFSGLFDLDTLSKWVSWIGPITPLYYTAEGMRDVMIRGAGFTEIGVDCVVLVGFAVLFTLLNIFALKSHRRL